MADKKIETLEDLVSLIKDLQESDKENESLAAALKFIVEIQKAADEAKKKADEDTKKGEGDDKKGEGDGEISAEDLSKAISSVLKEDLVPAIGEAVSKAVAPVVETIKGLSKVPGVLETMTTALTALTEKAFTEPSKTSESEEKMEGIEKAVKGLADMLEKIPVRKGKGASSEGDDDKIKKGEGDDKKKGEGDDDAGGEGPVAELVKSDEYTNEADPSKKLGMLLSKTFEDKAEEV